MVLSISQTVLQGGLATRLPTFTSRIEDSCLVEFSVILAWLGLLACGASSYSRYPDPQSFSASLEVTTAAAANSTAPHLANLTLRTRAGKAATTTRCEAEFNSAEGGARCQTVYHFG